MEKKGAMECHKALTCIHNSFVTNSEQGKPSLMWDLCSTSSLSVKGLKCSDETPM